MKLLTQTVFSLMSALLLSACFEGDAEPVVKDQVKSKTQQIDSKKKNQDDTTNTDNKDEEKKDQKKQDNQMKDKQTKPDDLRSKNNIFQVSDKEKQALKDLEKQNIQMPN